jgi:hypothetical protein
MEPEPATGSYPNPGASSPFLPIRFPKIHSNIISYVCLGLPSGLFPSGFPTKILHAFLISSMRVTWPGHLILLDLIILILFGEAYKLRSSSLCSLFQPPATSSLFDRNTISQEKILKVVVVIQFGNCYHPVSFSKAEDFDVKGKR